jgi:predicted dehydrogenase
MDTIPLALCGVPDGCWEHVARRLRAAVLDATLGPARPTRAEVERFLRNGRHVLVAAEPCWSRDELAALRDAAEAARVTFRVVNPDRYLPSRQLVREQLRLNLGAAGLVRLHRWEPADPAPVSPMGLPALLVRDLDLVLWLTGQAPDRVFAVERPQLVEVHLGFPGGGMTLVEYATLTGGTSYQALSVIGASGAAYADDHNNAQLLFRADGVRAVTAGEGPRQYAALVQAFVNALGGDTATDEPEFHRLYATTDAVRQSLSRGQAVAVEGR